MANRNLTVLVTGIIVLLAVLVISVVFWTPREQVNDGIVPTPTPVITPTATPDEDANITITNLTPQQEAGLPVVVEGQARVFENTLQVRLRDADGSILVERFVTAAAPDVGEFGPYRVELYYPEPAGQSGTVEAFQYSARDGSEIDIVSVPVRFRQVEAMEVQVFYSNRQEDPDMMDCAATYPTQRRIPRTQTVGRAALEQLLMGPTNDETDAGFFTNINMGTEINSLTIAERTARADFTAELDKGVGGSCLVQAIRSQITNTLTQFPTVDDVVISVEGRTEDVLQP